ncbi:MAG: HAD-IA family hydrolase [Duncaniella sp.]|nr:HAD-IA family hydrolase [Duncaniella sp.]MDE6389844.1 HAD-IA family hydrolase [Duncaniella sp.]
MNSDTQPGIQRFAEGAAWVWLDLDDTLVDFRAAAGAALRLVWEHDGVRHLYPDPREWAEAYTSHNHRLWDLYARGEITQEFLRLDRFATPLRPVWKGSEQELAAYARSLDPLYLDHLAANSRLLPGAAELMQAIRRAGLKTGILSNGFKGVQHRKLSLTGLDRLTDLVVLSDDIGVNKPDPRIFRHAMALAGEPRPEAHIMIGDNPATDIAGASAAGWRAILFDPAVSPVAPRMTAPATLAAGSLETLIPLFETLSAP